MLKKLLHFFVAIVFIGFAAVQYNDSDAFYWIFMYLAVAALPILLLINYNKKGLLNAFLLGMFGILLILKYPLVAEWFDAGKPKFIDYEPTSIKAVEGIREYLGILICFATSFVYIFIKNRGPNQETSII